MNPLFPPLYVILDAACLKNPAANVLGEMIESGVTLLQYRDKGGSARSLFEISSKLAKIWTSSFAAEALPRAHFIVNDRPDVALVSGAGGVHVGQWDLGVEDARAVVGDAAWVGVSTHTVEQVDQADRTSADYIAFGPIFPTTTKEKPDPLVGLRGLEAARRRTRKPLVAIGGITLERAAEVYAAGADSLAIARDILDAEDRAARACAYLETAVRIGVPKSTEPPNN